MAEEEEAFSAAKRVDDISAFDAFLAKHPESRHTAEARSLREALLARDEGCKAAIASGDPAVLRAFLRAHPKGAPAEQVRGHLRSLEPQTAFGRYRKVMAEQVGGRLRSLEPQTAFGRHRKVMAAVLLLVLFAGAAIAGLWLYQSAEDRLCTEARELADNKLTDFTLVTNSQLFRADKGNFLSLDMSSSSSLLQRVNDCAASCRTRPWCKAFERYSFSDCRLYENFNIRKEEQYSFGRINSDWCRYWFRRK